MLTLFPSDSLATCALVGAHDSDSIRVAFDEGEHAVARGQVSDVKAEVKKVNPVPACLQLPTAGFCPLPRPLPRPSPLAQQGLVQASVSLVCMISLVEYKGSSSVESHGLFRTFRIKVNLCAIPDDLLIS
ncbi:hypothetical protein EYF80_034806 [Liparis tanakae]|uniref:Uncharacterized protein n=1 Tax=Liparis tanakae TaxID=230148 RepID=A0A4Z2GNU3_9TELE|nr:hypothetical protein EYF80_034806 [Liparis tanakae]